LTSTDSKSLEATINHQTSTTLILSTRLHLTDLKTANHTQPPSL